MAGYSPTLADFDNDGWKDLFVTRGHVEGVSRPDMPRDQHNTVFQNLGGLKFRALTAEAGLAAQPPKRLRGSAVGDLNGDGKLDVVTSALSAPAEIWINDSPGENHWLAFKLEGTKSNRDGIGAENPASTHDSGWSQRVWDRVRCCRSGTDLCSHGHYRIEALSHIDTVDFLFENACSVRA